MDKKECAKYYMCEGKRRHHMPCPVNLVFNPNENVCDWPENVEDCESVTGGRKPWKLYIVVMFANFLTVKPLYNNHKEVICFSDDIGLWILSSNHQYGEE